MVIAGKFDDEDGVLGRQGDKEDDTDLCVYTDRQVHHHHPDNDAQQGDRESHDDSGRIRPAFILGSQNKIGDENRENKYQARARTGIFFLIGHGRPFVTE